MDENKELWNKCVEFHGHACGGLTIGYKAALYAIERLGLQLGGGGNAGCLSPDEEIVCISENDACGVDAIQVMLGCSVGKGNLLFHMRVTRARQPAVISTFPLHWLRMTDQLERFMSLRPRLMP